MTDSAARAFEPMSVEGFLRFIDEDPEREDQRWELHNGAPMLITGGTAAHALIAGNIDCALFARARMRGCEVMRGFLAKASAISAFELDVLVRCGPINPRSRYAADPVVVFEVLSPSTMRHDRGIKLEGYRALSSLRQIVFVYQDSVRVEAWLREGGDWAEEAIVLLSLTDVIPLPALDTELPVSIMYEGLAGALTP